MVGLKHTKDTYFSWCGVECLRILGQEGPKTLVVFSASSFLLKRSFSTSRGINFRFAVVASIVLAYFHSQENVILPSEYQDFNDTRNEDSTASSFSRVELLTSCNFYLLESNTLRCKTILFKTISCFIANPIAICFR